jgi:hypothetical protein
MTIHMRVSIALGAFLVLVLHSVASADTFVAGQNVEFKQGDRWVPAEIVQPRGKSSYVIKLSDGRTQTAATVNLRARTAGSAASAEALDTSPVLEVTRGAESDNFLELPANVPAPTLESHSEFFPRNLELQSGPQRFNGITQLVHSPGGQIAVVAYGVGAAKVSIQVCDLKIGGDGDTYEFPDKDRPLAVCKTRKLMLAERLGENGMYNGQMEIWSVDKTPRRLSHFTMTIDEKLQPIASQGTVNGTYWIQYAWFVDDTHLLTFDSRCVLSLWLLADKSLTEQYAESLDPMCEPRPSDDGRFVLAHKNAGTVILNAMTGKAVLPPIQIPVATAQVLSLSPSGKYLSSANSNHVLVVELSKSKIIGDFSFPNDISSSRADFVSDQLMLLDSSWLFDLHTNQIACAYRPVSGPAIQCVDGRLWYFTDESTSAGLRGTILTSVTMPDPIGKQLVSNLPDLPPVISPGSTLTLQWQWDDVTEDEKQRITAALTAKAQAAGFSIGDSQKYVLRVKVSDTPQPPVPSNRPMTRHPGQPQTPQQEMKWVRHTCELGILSGATEVWSTSTQLGYPLRGSLPAGMQFNPPQAQMPRPEESWFTWQNLTSTFVRQPKLDSSNTLMLGITVIPMAKQQAH